MFIRQVCISGVGPLNDVCIDMQAPGLNILLGPNECGKSTLCEAIDAVLYGFLIKERVAQLRSWGGAERMQGSLLLEANNEQLVRIVRDFESNHTTVHFLDEEQPHLLFDGDANPRGTTEQPLHYRDLLARELALPIRSAFHSAGFVGQLQMELEIDDELRRQISGAGQADTKKAEDLLSEQYYALTLAPLPGERPKRKERRIEVLQAAIQSQNASLQLARGQSGALADLREESTQLQEEKETLQAQQRTLTKYVQDLKAYLGLLDDFDNINRREEAEARQQEQIQRLQSDVGDLEAQLADPRLRILADQSESVLEKLRRYLHSDAEQTVLQIEQMQQTTDQLKQELLDERFVVLRDAPQETGDWLQALLRKRGQVRELQNQLPAEEIPQRELHWGRVLGAMLGGGLLGLGLGWLLQGQLGVSIRLGMAFFFGALAFALGFGVFSPLLHTLLHRQSVAERAHTLALIAQKEGLAAEVAELEQALGPVLQESDTSLGVLIERWAWVGNKRAEMQRLVEKREVLEGQGGVQLASDPELQPLLAMGESGMLAERLAQFESLGGRLSAKRDTLDGLQRDPLEPSGQTAARQDLRSVVARLEDLQAKHPGFTAYRADSAQGFARLEAEQAQLTMVSQELQQVGDRLHALDVEEAGMQAQAIASPSALEEDLEHMQVTLERLCARSLALALAVEVLRESIVEFEGDHLHRLAEHASIYFHRFTGGRYAGVELPAGDGVHVRAADERVFSNQQLSAGARDQLFFALRLAVADLLAADMQMPLLLDDPFVNFDAGRLAVARDVLADLAADRQVILLTHDERFKEWPGRVLQFEDLVGD